MTITAVQLSDTFNTWRAATNALIAQANAQLDSTVLGTLTTVDKSSLVAAINEINSRGIISGTVGGTVDAITVTAPYAVPSLQTNAVVVFTALGANATTTPTINVFGANGTADGAKPIVRADGTTAVIAGEFATNTTYILLYDGSKFRIISKYSSGSGLSVTTIKTANYTALAGEEVRCNTTGGAFNVVLPADPNDGTLVGILDVGGTFATNNVTVLRNGGKITGISDDLALNVNNTYIQFEYVKANGDWRILTTPMATANSILPSQGGNAGYVLTTDGSTATWQKPITTGAATLASAATLNIGAASGDYITVTGTTTITAFDNVAAGTERTLKFNGALTLTHNATSLILPGGANFVVAAGDTFTFRSEGSGNWRCISYSLANGQPITAPPSPPMTAAQISQLLSYV